MTKPAPNYHPHYAATVWPSGDFTVSTMFKVAHKETHKYETPNLATQAWLSALALKTEKDRFGKDLSEALVLEHALRLESISRISKADWQRGVNVAAGIERCSILGLSDATKPHKTVKKRSRRGLTGITSYGRRMVRSCVALMSEGRHKNEMSFGTATVPPLSDAARLKLADNWSKLCKQFLQWVKRQNARAGLPTDVVIISEIQEERLSETGEAYPHLHWFAVGKHSRYDKQWAIPRDRIDKMWKRLLERFTEELIENRSSCKMQAPYSDPKKELGKYMSKGAALIRKAVELGETRYMPSAWWQAPFSLRSKVKELTMSFDAPVAYALRANLDKLQKLGIASGRVIVGTQTKQHGEIEVEFGAVGFFLGENGLSTFLDIWQDLAKIEIFTPKQPRFAEAISA